MKTLVVSLIFCLMVLSLASRSEAACGGSGLNRVAASPSQNDVTDCINAAPDGATISVPAGSATWSGIITTSTTSDHVISGAGSSSTIITCSGTCMHVSTQRTIRITGFTFTGTDVGFDIGPNDTAGAGKTVRIDHNSISVSGSNWGTIQVSGGTVPARHPTVLIDNNTLTNMTVKTTCTNFLRSESAAQDQCWAQQTDLGGGTEVTYVEDNVMNNTVFHPNWSDGNTGARYVVRFNSMTGHASGIEVHSVQEDNRAVQRWEFYKNTLTKPDTSSGYPVGFIRGGTGVAWGNRANNNFGSNGFLLDNIRSQTDLGVQTDGVNVGGCDGTSNWDQNTPGMSGYVCRDQIGRSRDLTVWSPGNAYTQVFSPAYFWDNLTGTTQTPMQISDACGQGTCFPYPGHNPLDIVQNRDFYSYTASFNGTAGVGMGSLSARPTTCTVGVAYWATDQGKWNSRQSGPNGQLYKCTATNTWSLYYVPYTYPHPLQSGSIHVPTAPTNLRITQE